MKKTIFAIVVIIATLIIIITYALNYIGFCYYKNLKFSNLDNAYLISKAVNSKFFTYYELNNLETIDIASAVAHYERKHNLQFLLKQGIYLKMNADSITICSKGFDKEISNKYSRSQNIGLFDYLKGNDIVLFSDVNNYQLCGIRPWEHKCFIGGKLQSDKQNRQKIHRLGLNLQKLLCKELNKEQLTTVLFYGVKSSATKFKATCICQRQPVDSSVIQQALNFLRNNSFIEVESYYLPVRLPKK